MSKLILFAGQSAGNALFDAWPGAPVALPDTHVWNGTAWITPVGNGIVNYCNHLKLALNEPIYAVNACVDGMGLIGANSWTTSSAASNAIANTQAAIAALPGCTSVDRIEFWGCQTDCLYSADYGPILDGFTALLGVLRTGLGPDFRFCIWPVGSVSSGSMTQVVRAQIDFSTGPSAYALGVEPGPASYERLYSDQNHLADGTQYGVMGGRGAINAASYFAAKAAGTLATPHYGAGPRIIGIQRGGAANRVLVNVAVKPGFCLQPVNPWGSSSVALSCFGMWWGVGSKAQLNVIGIYLLGGQIAIDADTGLAWACAVGNHWERGGSIAASVYDTQGQPLMQHTSEMLVSN